MPTCILVVDDSPTIRTVVSTILERHGYDPKVASDGQDAYEALASGEVKADLVLLDFVMPHMNGYQFCRALRDNADLTATPVVLMSAKADRMRAELVEQTGALDAISKPFDAQALVAVIENALRRVNGAQAASRASSRRLDEIVGRDRSSPKLLDGPDAEAPTGEHAAVSKLTFDAQRTPASEVVARKLAGIVAKTITQTPEVIAPILKEPPTGEPSSPSTEALTSAIAQRLSREPIVEMMEPFGALDSAGARPALSGDLAIVPIGAILQLLQAENQTGVLVCSNGDTEVRATFRGGAIDLVEASGASDEFRLGRFFVEEGILSPEELDVLARQAASLGGPDEPAEPDGVPRSSVHLARRTGTLELAVPQMPAETLTMSTATFRDDPHGMKTMIGRSVVEALAAVTQKQRPLGTTLVATGRIGDSQLRSALTRQSSELLYEVLRWSAGRFELRREPPSELADSARLGLPVASVVMEGFRRVDEWRVLERSLGSFDSVLVRDDTAFGALDLQSLPAKERAVLEAIDGQRSVRAIIAASNLSSFDACRILVQLMEARAVRRRVA